MIVQHDASLRHCNTLGFTSIAQALVETSNLASLRRALALGRCLYDSVTPLGGGSNVVLKDWLPGLVIRHVGKRYWHEKVSEHEALWHVEAGLGWHELVEKTTAAGWWGIENLALIPGSVGAAPIQNIGAYGVEIGDVLESVHVVYMSDGRYKVLSHAECAFGYRNSIFKQALASQVMIVRVVLRLSLEGAARTGYGDLAARLPADAGPADVANAVASVRREKLPDPNTLGSAGSFFKNPLVSRAQAVSLLARWPELPTWPAGDHVKLAAGWLIDQCGWKGYRGEGVGIHQRQALVMVHYGDSSACSLLALAARVTRSVAERFGVTLEMEPGILGLSASQI